MAIILERLSPRFPLWAVGTVVLFCQSLFLLASGGVAFVFIEGIGWLLAVDLRGDDYLPFLLITAAFWAPVATGQIISVMSKRLTVVGVGGRSSQGAAQEAALAGSFQREDRLGPLTVAMVALGILAANIAPFVLLVEFVEWLTSREWPGFTLADGLALFGAVQLLPESDSERLIDLLLAVPLSITLFAVGVLLCMAGLSGKGAR